MNEALIDSTRRYCEQHLGLDLDRLLEPIDGDAPAGVSLRANGVYRDIREARRRDDASLPMGPWPHDLKRADWRKVARIASEALAEKSKDIQLAAWLFESQINLNGFAAIAPSLTIIQGLLETFSDDVHPQAEAGDQEHRVNIIRWVVNKLLPELRQVPITQCGGDSEYAWADWEHAKRNDYLRERGSQNDASKVPGPSLDEVQSALQLTSLNRLRQLEIDLTAAQVGINQFAEMLNDRFGVDGPSVQGLADLVRDVGLMIAAELTRRGVRSHAPPVSDRPVHEDEATASQHTEELIPQENDACSLSNQRITDRASAYAQLAQIAQYLKASEPHSPTPYLLQLAIQWGVMNTSELFEELFIKRGGQIGVFQMLGIQPATESA